MTTAFLQGGSISLMNGLEQKVLYATDDFFCRKKENLIKSGRGSLSLTNIPRMANGWTAGSPVVSARQVTTTVF